MIHCECKCMQFTLQPFRCSPPNLPNPRYCLFLHLLKIQSNLVPPRPDLCDASEGTPFPSPAPGSPTATPTVTPLTLKPISRPTAAPVQEPTPALTLKPVSPPTKKPSNSGDDDDDDDDDNPKPTKKPTPAMSMRMRELDWFDFANLGVEDLQGDDTFGETKKEEERQRLGLGGLDRRILKRRRRQQQ